MNIHLQKFLRYIMVFFFIVVFILLNGCNESDFDANLNKSLPATSDIDYTDMKVLDEFKDINDGRKIYITSIGQSIEIEQFIMYVDYFDNVEYINKNDLIISEVEDGSLVFCIVGCSVKAMVDAGVTNESEENRALGFAKASNENKITLITCHLGGMSRRGSTSDELIMKAISMSDLFIFVKSGNSDLFLTQTISKYNVPGLQLDSINAIINPLEVLFGSN